MALLERLKRKVTHKRTVQTRSWGENGLHAVEGNLSTHIAWSEVCRVHAYKKDCFVVDQIRLTFVSDQHAIEFTEDDFAFSDLCAFANEKLGIAEDWHYRLVTAPAFQTTFTNVYPRSSANPVDAQADS